MCVRTDCVLEIALAHTNLQYYPQCAAENRTYLPASSATKSRQQQIPRQMVERPPFTNSTRHYSVIGDFTRGRPLPRYQPRQQQVARPAEVWAAVHEFTRTNARITRHYSRIRVSFVDGHLPRHQPRQQQVARPAEVGVLRE
jgi:hypothetical protein